MRRIPLQIAEMALLATALLVGIGSGTPQTGIEMVNATPTLTAHVDRALDLFATHGLAEPVVASITFDAEDPFCDRHGGRFTASTAAVLLCFDADTVVEKSDGTLRDHEQRLLLHELAHAWIETHSTQDQRSAYTSLMGANSWNDHSSGWYQRGTEMAAETFVFALTDGDVLPRTLASRDPGLLREGYDLLIGAPRD